MSTLAGRRYLPQLAGRLGLVAVLAATLSAPACVYFNTYYNARKLFRQAEQARLEQEREAATPGRGGRRAGRRPVGTAADLYDKAARRAAKVLDQYRTSDLVDDAMFLMGRALYWQGDYLNALRAFRDLESSFPTSEYYAQARYWAGLCLEAQSQTGEARSIYRALVADGRGEVAPQSGLRLGEMAFARGQYLEAIREYQATLQAFARAANRAELWLRLGEAAVALQDSAREQQALDAFARVLREHPSPELEYRARLNRGRVLYARGDAEGALAAYRGLLGEGRFRGYEGQTRLLIGQYYQDRRQTEPALREYEQVRDDFPQSESAAMALYRTGLLYLQERGDLEQAREYFQEAPKEKGGSEGADLAQEKLKQLDELGRLQARIRKADSLAVAAAGDSAAPGSAVPDSAARAAGRAPADTTQGRQLQADLLAVAEVYRDQLAQPDSAARYYEEVIRRFPASDQMPRTLYSLAWVRRELAGDPAAAVPYLERLVSQYPESVQSNEARRLLGQPPRITDEDRAAAAYASAESLWVRDPRTPETYGPRLDSLVVRYPGTRAAAQAAYLAAWVQENVVGDTAAANRRYDRLLAAQPSSEPAALVRRARQAREEGLAEKLSQELQAVGRPTGGDQRLRLIAVEPDTADTSALARKFAGFAVRAHRRTDLPRARRFYELSLEQQDRNPTALCGLGQIMSQEGYFQDARDYFRRALRYDGGLLVAHYGLLSAYTEAGLPDSANYYLREVVRRDRRNPQIEQLLTQYPELAQAQTAEKSGPSERAYQLDRSELEGLHLAAPDEEEPLTASRLGLREGPLLRTENPPEYPAEGEGDSVRVYVDALVGLDGKPDSVLAVQTEDPYARAAVNAVRTYRFFPAVAKAGAKVRAGVELAVMVLPAPPKAPAGAPPPAAAAPGVSATPQESDAGRDRASVLQPRGGSGVLPDTTGSPPDSL